jgi:hypothetical protein
MEAHCSTGKSPQRTVTPTEEEEEEEEKWHAHMQSYTLSYGCYVLGTGIAKSM